MDAGLFIDGVTIALEEREIVSLTKRVAPGGVLTVMGPSGAGKSTLLAYIGGFLDPVFSARGRVFVDGTEVTALKPEDRHVGVLFQDPLLFPHMSVGGNLMFALPEAVRGRAAR
ncbi:ATP-binding cassette domain-containing protein, partial [Nitratireductor aquibiodomus]